MAATTTTMGRAGRGLRRKKPLPSSKLARVPERIAVVAFSIFGLALGYGLARMAAPFGSLAPVVVVALPLMPVLMFGVLDDPRVAAITAFATIPIGTAHLGALPTQLIIVVVAGFTVIVGLRRFAAGRNPLAWSPPMWWLAGLLAWSVIGYPGAIDSGLAIRQIAQLGGGMLYASLVLAACRNTRDVRVVVAGFLAVSFVIGLTAVAGGHQLQARYGGALVAGRAQGVFTQPNELGSFCAPLALLALAVAVSGPSTRIRVAAGGVGLAVVAALALSLSRGAWIGFGLGSAVLVLMLPRARRLVAFLTPFLLLLALGMGAFAPSNPQVQVIGERLKSISGEKNPYDDRPAIWAEARREVRTNPLLGEGAGTFPVASVASTSESRTTYAVHAHNLFLTWAAETGLPGAGCLVGLCVHLGLRARRARRYAQRTGNPVDAAIVAGSAAALVAVVGQGMVDYTLRNSVIFVAVCGLAGLLMASIRVATTPADST
ncbi:MAG TPA: O-antigen ligase family protein [Acidimicrobiales bacterium]|jgi:O-antigen ligase|nr:O-antigen ligase family protein [Acidimicrobiales bacterium]